MHNERKLFVSAFLSIMFSVIILYLIGTVISQDIPTELLINIESIFSVDSDSFSPEPGERNIFIITVLCFPIIMGILYLTLNKLLNRFSILFSKYIYYFAYSLSIIIMFLLIFLYFREIENSFFVNNLFVKEYPLLFVAGSLFIGVMVYYSEKFDCIAQYSTKVASEKTIFIINSLVVLFILFIGFSNVYSIYSLEDTGQYTSHFNAVFHSMAVVHAGESMLVDITNQYGLYPHILELVFAVIGLSVFKFTFVMGILISLSLYLFYKVLDKLIANKIYSVLAFSFVLFYGYVHFKIVSQDPYFQYYPIRTLFPSLLIYCSLKYFENKNSLKYYIFTFLFSISVLWNLDSGLIVFLTWILVLGFDEALNWSDWISFSKKCIKHLVVSISALIIVLLVFTLYIYFRSGTVPNLIEFFNYQIYFYGYGFFMLPMKMIHPWNLVALVYILGLLYSLNGVLKKENTLLVRMIFLLSILGVGLFSYYQGRSHDHVLTLVWYPALMLLVLFIYMLYCKVQNKIIGGVNKNWLQIIVLLLLVLFIFSAASSLGRSTSTIYQLLEQRWLATFEEEETVVTSGVDFIKGNTTEGEETLILSYHSGVDYLYSKTIPAIDIPGMSELFLNKEYDIIYEAIENSPLQKIFVDKNFISNIQLNNEGNIKAMNLLFENFKIVGKSDNDNVLMLSRKSDTLPTLNPTLLPNSQSIQHYRIYDNFFMVDPLSNQVVGSMEYSPPIVLGQKFSIEVVVKPNNIQKPYAAVLGNHPGDGFQGFVLQQENDNKNVYTFNYGDGLNWSTPLSFLVEPDKWNYLTIVFNKGDVRAYRNGELITEETESLLDHIGNSEMPISIGNWVGKDREFNGVIREVKISDGILSDQDILDNWNGMIDRFPN